MKKFDRVYQFKIHLKNLKPLIWRRIQVPETYTFWDLHVAIQDSMGWLDYHLHEFKVKNPSTGLEESIGIPDDFGEMEMEAGWELKISDFFSLENAKAEYVYDFGDNWEHQLELEKILPRDRNLKYPICIAGKRACPPEDCGGFWGYEDFLKIIKDPTHEEHLSMLEWAGGEFDPEKFDPQSVHFDNPKKRWEFAFKSRY
jgi:hypothetical protein